MEAVEQIQIVCRLRAQASAPTSTLDGTNGAARDKGHVREIVAKGRQSWIQPQGHLPSAKHPQTQSGKCVRGGENQPCAQYASLAENLGPGDHKRTARHSQPPNRTCDGMPGRLNPAAITGSGSRMAELVGGWGKRSPVWGSVESGPINLTHRLEARYRSRRRRDWGLAGV